MAEVSTPGRRRLRGVLLDVDGTLVDSVDAHAWAWVDALREHGYDVPHERVRPLIGMGGDKVLPELTGVQKESHEGKWITDRRAQLFKERYLPGVRASPGARQSVRRLLEIGLRVVVATSAQEDEL